jgi:hypothetical protein
MEQRTMSYEEQEAARRERLAEVGTLSPCPMCQTPRCLRTDYVRCNRCGVNWLDGEDLGRNPRSERWEKLLASLGAPSIRSTGISRTAPDGSASSAIENK